MKFVTALCGRNKPARRGLNSKPSDCVATDLLKGAKEMFTVTSK